MDGMRSAQADGMPSEYTPIKGTSRNDWFTVADTNRNDAIGICREQAPTTGTGRTRKGRE
ncbi:hypothetical protein JCM30394_36110 [Deferrisoma palaeochoriense]